MKTILFYCAPLLGDLRGTGHCQSDQSRVGLNIALPEDATEVATTQVDFAGDVVEYYSEKYFYPPCPTGDMLPIIFFALFVGILLAAMGNRSPLWRTFSASSMTL